MIPVAEDVMLRKCRCIGRRIGRACCGVRERKTVPPIRIQDNVPPALRRELRAPGALGRELPVGPVGFRPRPEDTEGGAAVGRWIRVAPRIGKLDSCFRTMSKQDKIKRPYVEYREEIIGFPLYHHATLRGFRAIPPPQARPTHPTALGATTWRTTSYAELSVTGLGMATRNVT